MSKGWFESFIDGTRAILDKPPYLIFVFISAVFVVISLITDNSFDETWAFFIYSAGGTIWRYIERDFLRHLDKYPTSKLWIISIYHIGNLGLLAALVAVLVN